MYVLLQVITTILKTLVDNQACAKLHQTYLCSSARDKYKENNNKKYKMNKTKKSKKYSTIYTTEYKGINLTAKAKTPGDAWGGVEDGDDEEATVIIRQIC